MATFPCGSAPELLVEEVAERLAARSGPPAAVAPQPEPPSIEPPAQPEPEPAQRAVLEPEQPAETEPEDEVPSPPRAHAAPLMGRLALGLLVLVVLINVPLNRRGTTLATAMPDTASLAIRDGLVVKEEDDPDIYVYRGGQFRWISSLDAFEHYGFTWGDVHIVEDGFLDVFEIGRPLHVLLKCQASPHVYRLERGQKRWIVDIDAFEAEGHVWEDVRFVACEYLRGLPDGETIPPGQGPPPQP